MSLHSRLLKTFAPTLGTKVLIAVAATLIVAGSVFVYFAHRTGYSMLEDQSRLKARSMAGVLRGVLEYVMLEGKSDHLQQTLESIVVPRDVTNVYIVRTDGSIAFRAKNDSTGSRIPLEQFQPISGSGGDESFAEREEGSLIQYVLTPIRKKPECVRCHPGEETIRGYIALKVSMEDLKASAAEHRTMNIAMTAATFVGLGLIISLSLTFLVIRPIRSLHSHIHRVEESAGNQVSGERPVLPVLPESANTDEIGDLSRDFNTMVRRLNDAAGRLHEVHQRELEQADRLATTGEMAASMAHEIRNPIAGVLGALQVFDSEVGEDDARKEILEEMMRQLVRVNQAVNDLLSYARPTPPAFEEFPINELIQRTVPLVESQINGKSITVLSHLSPDEPVLEGDRKQMQQVLWNILLNGIQAIESSGTVSISSGRGESMVRIEICDTGKGIPADQVEKVFKPFYTTKHKGTGLGMTISRRIIEQHHGSIAVTSEAGKGTTVRILLPLHQPNV